MPRRNDRTFRCDECRNIRNNPPEVCGPHGETWCGFCAEVVDGADLDDEDDNYPED